MDEQSTPQKAQDRLDVLEKQRINEINGIFDVDLEPDAPKSRTIRPGEVDFKRKRLINKIKAKLAFSAGRKFIKKMQKAGMLQIDSINGIENIKNLKSGAILTCNHFNPFDSFAMQIAYESARPKGRKFFRVINETNYTDFPGFYGFLMRNCNTLPLSENRTVMSECFKAINELLKEGHLVLIYPEQAMWWNYRKPRPLKIGAYRFAAKNNVPVVPVFITMQDSEQIGPDGFPIQKYTINVEKPIYPDPSKSFKENSEAILNENSRVWKEIYEKQYGKKLEFMTNTETLNTDSQ